METTGAHLTHGGVSAVEDHLDELEGEGGGVYFIDEAYQLIESGGKAVLDYLFTEIAKRTGEVVYIFAGHKKEMGKFFENRPGLVCRLPYRLHCEDYTDLELLRMLMFKINQVFNSKISVEDGLGGLYMRIAIR